MTTTTTGISRLRFAQMLLQRLLVGASQNPYSMVALCQWMELENTRAVFNPLATTFETVGSTKFNSAGVQNYQSVGMGVSATASTLTGPTAAIAKQRGYTDIVDALEGPEPGESAADWFHRFAAAVQASKWYTGDLVYRPPFPSQFHAVGGSL